MYHILQIKALKNQQWPEWRALNDSIKVNELFQSYHQFFFQMHHEGSGETFWIDAKSEFVNEFATLEITASLLITQLATRSYQPVPEPITDASPWRYKEFFAAGYVLRRTAENANLINNGVTITEKDLIIHRLDDFDPIQVGRNALFFVGGLLHDTTVENNTLLVKDAVTRLSDLRYGYDLGVIATTGWGVKSTAVILPSQVNLITTNATDGFYTTLPFDDDRVWFVNFNGTLLFPDMLGLRKEGNRLYWLPQHLHLEERFRFLLDSPISNGSVVNHHNLMLLLTNGKTQVIHYPNTKGMVFFNTVVAESELPGTGYLGRPTHLPVFDVAGKMVNYRNMGSGEVTRMRFVDGYRAKAGYLYNANTGSHNVIPEDRPVKKRLQFSALLGKRK